MRQGRNDSNKNTDKNKNNDNDNDNYNTNDNKKGFAELDAAMRKMNKKRQSDSMV